ncbi:hypothetical protein CDL12_14013 [Handroanthus impetiginosus]|uniref:Uncharacterized protein n=1 Tax=Handroanthus impetiginosus TaxID=429701 RepID=A0A2G9H778_9LAMI|nr:hypothetical protein CDL12_14013 [Handroanthus impetiginosus]
MMQSEPLMPSWPSFNFTSLNHNIPYDQEMDFFGVDDLDLSCSFASPVESSLISSNSIDTAMFSNEFFPEESCVISPTSYVPTIFSDEFLDLENLCNEIQICSPMEGDEWSPCLSSELSQNSILCPLVDMSLVLPGDEMEVDDQLSLLHLLKAYGEAMENGEKELAKVIVTSINNKTSPLGTTMERVGYNLFQSREKEGEHLREESIKNMVAAFKVLYQSLPNGRFAHFTANSAILESVPNDADTIHIVDFDMGEAVQWPPLIETFSRKQKALKLTSMISEEKCTSCCWDFEDTKKRLLTHAGQCGVNLHIEERRIEDLGGELMRMKRRGKEWIVFNCMVGLPHMGRKRSRGAVNEFLKVAEELVANFEGIVILGDGDQVGESKSPSCNYASYFDNLLKHYQAVFESLEKKFESLEKNSPVYLSDARIAVESVFLAPFMCPVSWFQDWVEMTKIQNHRAESQLKGRKLSDESLAEAKQMVNERENSHKVKMRQNEMVLQWKETPLVRVSTWM